MITDPAYFSRFKRVSLAKQTLSLEEKYSFLESLYNEARTLGKFTQDDILIGLDNTIRLASALNSNVSGTSR